MDPEESFPDDEVYRPPLPADDRVWRHPSELGAAAPGHDAPGQDTARHDAPRRPAGLAPASTRRRVTGVLVAMAGAAALIGTTALVVGRVEDSATENPSAVRIDRGSSTTLTLLPAAPTTLATARPASRAVVHLTVTTPSGRRSLGAVSIGGGVLLTPTEGLANATSIVMDQPSGSDQPKMLGVDSGSGLTMLATTADPVAATPTSAVGLQPGAAVAIAPAPAGATIPHTIATKVTALGQTLSGPKGTVRHLLLIQIHQPGDLLGAGVLDDTGRLVAIVTAIRGDQVFATPVMIGAAAAESLEATGRVRVPWLGVEGVNAEAQWARSNGVNGGAVVLKRTTGSPISGCALVDGDVIVALDGEPTPSMAALAIAVRSRAVGDTVSVTYRHGTTTSSATVTLVEAPNA